MSRCRRTSSSARSLPPSPSSAGTIRLSLHWPRGASRGYLLARVTSLLRRISQLLGRWPVALATCVVLAALVLLPGLGTPGLWEPQERQLSDRLAPPLDPPDRPDRPDVPNVPNVPVAPGTQAGSAAKPPAPPPHDDPDC